MFSKKGVLRSFAKLTRKHLCQSLFLHEAADLGLLRKAIKKETLAQVFSCEFCEISKNSFSTEHIQATASEFLQKDEFNIDEFNVRQTKVQKNYLRRKKGSM